MYEEYQVIQLKGDRKDLGLSAGAVGTILIIYEGTSPAYEIEFLDKAGNTLALSTLKEEDIQPIADW